MMRDTLRDDGGGRGGGAEADAVVSPPPSGTAVVAHAAPHRRAGRVTGRKRKTTRGGGRAPPSPDGAIIQTGKRGEGGGGPRLPPPPPPPPPACGPRTAARARALSPTQTRPDQNKRKKNTDRCYTGYPPVPDTLPSTSLPHSLCWRLLIPDPPPSIHAPLAPTPLTLPPIPHCETVGRGGWGRSLKTAPAP